MESAKRRMLADIERETALTAGYTGITELDPRVMQALFEVPREAFVPEDMHVYAYDNRPLPIGHGQTISQPYIVALMTHLLNPQSDHRVLEVGTGSGYQAAVLSRLVDRLYTIDRVPELSDIAHRTLDRLGYHNIEYRTGNGFRGWPEEAPYDGIIVTAAPEDVPPALLEQLRPGGRLVIPVGPPFGHQQLLSITKREDGQLHSTEILPVAFVPMQDDSGGPDDRA